MTYLSDQFENTTRHVFSFMEEEHSFSLTRLSPGCLQYVKGRFSLSIGYEFLRSFEIATFFSVDTKENRPPASVDLWNLVRVVSPNEKEDLSWAEPRVGNGDCLEDALSKIALLIRKYAQRFIECDEDFFRTILKKMHGELKRGWF